MAVGRDQSVTAEKLRVIFDAGTVKFPTYIPLYREMLVSLMPRWSGSYDAVDRFIADVSRKSGRGQIDPAMYARLYLIYANLEGDDFNVAASMNVSPTVMKSGLDDLRQRYPKSDYILNSVARYYCVEGNYFDYRGIQPLLRDHDLSSAWPDKASIESRNRWNS